MKTMLKTLLLVLLGSFISMYLNAQIDIEGKIKQKARERAEQRIDEGIDKALDATEEGVEDTVSGENEGKKDATETGKENDTDQESDQESEKNETNKAEPATGKPQGLATYSKYDFVPGEKVILFEDFAQDAVGDFPVLWNTNATGEVMLTSVYPGKWFKPMGDGVFLLEKLIPFPDNFTIEFDVIPFYKEGAGDCDFILTIYENPELSLDNGILPGNAGYNLRFSEMNHTFGNYNQDPGNPNEVHGESSTGLLVPEKLNKIKIWVQKQRIRVYIEEKKVFDLPRGIMAGFKYNHFRLSTTNTGGEPLISNIRIATGRPDMRNKLLTEGKLVTYGIYFDSGKDIVKPESYATLKEIATILQENPEIRIRIVGHTDSDGDNTANLDLSKRRAVSVKGSLVKDFAINTERIETEGKGETEPIASNNTAEGKAGNRRVEIIRL